MLGETVKTTQGPRTLARCKLPGETWGALLIRRNDAEDFANRTHRFIGSRYYRYHGMSWPLSRQPFGRDRTD